MASLKDLAKRIFDKTDLDERVVAGINRVRSKPLSTYNIYNPQTFAKASRAGSNTLNFIASQPLPQQNNPILQGLQSAGQEIVRNTGQGLKAMSTGIEQRKPLTFAAGAFRTAAPVIGAGASPAYSLGGIALGGAIGALTNKDRASGFGSGAVRGLKTAAVTRFTDPVISKGLSKLAPGSSLLKRQVAQRVGGGLANVAEDEIIARIDQLKTSTPEKALSFIIGAGISGNDQLIDAAKNALRKGDKKQIKRVANTLADELQRKYKGKTPPGYKSTRGSNQYVNIVEPSKPKFSSDLNRQLGLDPYPKNALQDLNAVGAVAGFEQDEEGKWRYDPAKGAAGLAVATLGTKATKGANIPPLSKQTGTQLPPAKASSLMTPPPKPQSVSQPAQTERMNIKQSLGSSLEDIIQEGRKQIGETASKPEKNTKETLDTLYTQWVDRYNPLTKASKKAKGILKLRGAELRPEYDPEYLVRRLTGAGGIADQRFKTELNPVLKQIEQSGIEKIDIDVYLANKRIAGFGKAGREVYGADPVKAKQVIGALEAKYGDSIKQISDQLYAYQNKGFQEMVDAGFISPESAKIIRQQNPDYSPLYRVMDEVNNYLGLPTRKAMQGSQPIKKIKGSERQIESPLESIIGNTFSQRAAIEKNRVARSLVGLQEVAGGMGFKKVSKAGDNTITVWRDGKKEYWDVGQDIAETVKGLNEENMNTVLKIFQAPASLLRQGATGRNIEFMIPNVLRDQLDAGITSKYGYIPFVDYFNGLASMVKNDDVYRKWANSGAKIDLGEISGRKGVKKLFDEKTKKRSLFNWISQGLDVAGKYSEEPTRVGLFKKAYQKTGNELLAMLESRDGTVDFARMGNKMKTANSIIPFLNVGVQGFDKLIRAAKGNPKKVLFNVALYGATPALTTTLYNLTTDPEGYAEIPQYEKDSNFVIVQGRNEDGTVDYLTFPKGNVLPIVTNPATNLVEYLFDNDQQSFKEMALSTLTSALPVVGDGSSLKEIGIKTVGQNLPQAIKPITENLMNKSFYKFDPKKQDTKEIVPYYLKDKPAYQQDYEFTPQMYKKIGAVLNTSPLQVKNLMEGYLAGYVKIPAQLIEMLHKVSRGEEISRNDKTLLRRFAKQTYTSVGDTKNVPKEKTVVPSLMERVTGKVSAAETTQELPSDTQSLSVLYKDAKSTVDKYAENKTKAQYGLVDKDLGEYQAEFDESYKLLRQIEEQYPERVFEINTEVYKSGGGRSTEERGNWVAEQLEKETDPDKRQEMINKLWEAKVLTTGNAGTAQYLEDMGIDVSKYTGNNVNIKKSNAKKTKTVKVSIKTVKPTPVRFDSGKQPFQLPNITPGPILKLKKAPRLQLSSRIKAPNILTAIK